MGVKSSRRAVVRAAVILLSLFLIVGRAHAGDVETAKKNLETAKEQLKDQSWNSIEESLNGVEPFLDGVPDADKAPILKELAEVRKAALPQVKAFKAKGFLASANRFVDGAANEVQAVPETAAGDLKRAQDVLNSDDAKKYIDADAMTKIQARIAGLQTMAFKGVKKNVLARIAPVLKDLEDQVAADPFKGKSQDEAYRVGQSLNSLASRVRGGISDLPKDDPDVVAINARLATAVQKVDMSANAGEKADAVAKLANYWNGTKDYFKGWEAETQSPTFERYSKESSEAMSSLMMPKTIEAISRTKGWLKDVQSSESLQKYKDDPQVKAIVDDATRTLDTAAAKLSGAFNKLLDEAEKLDTPTSDSVRSRPDMLADRAAFWFGDTKYMDANVARAKKLHDKWQGAVAGAAAAADELFTKMEAAAAAAWPKIEASIPAQEGFNPAELDKWKGKTIKLKGVYNRSGWDFDGAYDFAKKINGLAVAGNYAPNVKAAFNDVAARTKKSPDDHEKWDIIGVVQGPGKINERTSADVKDGSTTIGRVEGNRPVDCAVLQIIAIHAGPVAVGPDGAVSETGAIAQPAGATGSAAGTTAAAVASTAVTVVSWVFGIIWFIVGLAAAAVAFMKAKAYGVAQPAAVPAGTETSATGTATVAPGGVLNYAPPALLKGDNLSYAGLVFAILGVIHLLRACVLGDLLPASAMALAGVYAASDFLVGKNILKPAMFVKLKPLGIPITGACAFFALIHLFLGNWWLL